MKKMKPGKCLNCEKELGNFRLTGEIDGERAEFCGFACHDEYMDRRTAVASNNVINPTKQ